jgi:hypothetical protein
VCPDTEDWNTIEHCRLSQCDRTQTYTEEVHSKQNFQPKDILH